MLSSKKRILPQNTVFSAEQSEIIEAIQSETNNRQEKVITTDSLSMIMAAENRTPTKNPKTQTIRKKLDHEEPKITLLWVPSHVGIPGNEMISQGYLNHWEIPARRPKEIADRRGFQKERPKMEKRKQRDERREAGRRQEGGYERNAHGPKTEGVSNPLCPFCNTYLSVDYILWECNETEDQRMNMDMRKEQ
jgi:hypothetical protein